MAAQPGAMDEMTAVRQLGERLAPAEVSPALRVEAAVRGRTTGGVRPARGPLGSGPRWGAPLVAAAAVAVVVLATRGLTPLGADGGRPAAAGDVPPSSAGRQPAGSASAKRASDPPMAADRYVYTRVRFVEGVQSAEKGFVQVSGEDESWASADGRGAVVQHNGSRPAPGEGSYSAMREGWRVATQLGPDRRAGRPGQDLRGDVRFGWTASPGGQVPALPDPATTASVEAWLVQVERAVVGDSPGRVAALRAPTWAFGPGNQPEAVDVFALIPPSGREAVFQAVSRRPGATRHTVTVGENGTMIAIDGGTGAGRGDDPWVRMLFDPTTHAFTGIQDVLAAEQDGLPAGTVVKQYLIEQQAVVDRPGSHPDGTSVPVPLTPSQLPTGDPARAHLAR